MSEVEFKREERYIVVKIKHLAGLQIAPLRNFLRENCVPTLDCVVVESDWPEYEKVWRSIERRMTGQPAEDFDAQRLRADTAEVERDTERKFRESAEGGWREANRVIAMQREKLDADEQRIAELKSVLERMLEDDDMPVHWFAQRIDAALNPNPEAESHDRLDDEALQRRHDDERREYFRDDQ